MAISPAGIHWRSQFLHRCAQERLSCGCAAPSQPRESLEAAAIWQRSEQLSTELGRQRSYKQISQRIL